MVSTSITNSNNKDDIVEGSDVMNSIKEVLISRDKMTPEEADDLIADAKADLFKRLEQGEMPEDICGDWFGLEPDYIDELIG